MNQGPEKSKTDDKQKAEKIPFWRVMLSVLQASFGVQSAENKNRDFSQGKLLPFIVAAILFTVCFIGLIMLAVNLVLS